jgi:hypothetical protein
VRSGARRKKRRETNALKTVSEEGKGIVGFIINPKVMQPHITGLLSLSSMSPVNPERAEADDAS